MSTYEEVFHGMGQKARQAAYVLQSASKDKKNEALQAIARILTDNIDEILAANEKDMALTDQYNLPSIMLDRLKLTKERILQMAKGVAEVVELEDPVGIVLDETTRPNGLLIKKVSVPIGVIAMLYEARPNVTVDAAALCLKSGNAVILRGGKEAFHSNQCLVALIRQAVESVGLPTDSVQLVEILDRQAVSDLLRQRQYIDVVIPRGGAGLIKRIVEESRIPVIETGSGVVHIYVDKNCDEKKLIPIIINAKVQRPSVCNAAETLLIHESVAAQYLPQIVAALKEHHVSLMGDAQSRSIIEGLEEASDSAWSTEYNDYVMNVKVVPSIEAAIEHINTYGTKHSEAIITEDEVAANTFMQGVDASTVYRNASTRFTDGFEFGFGAEIGISTQKLHARGPMGLPALTSYKYLVYGEGQVRK
ncbi:glutamate-5-semialdehyde dehydrogenase [uncultured Veillonella sp.]|uniref:glutamate-5-semialdehyde dehydrogenase n=1 Tax=uncultured Veillonella sp. TaxID=159268 RepID=UPI0025D2FA74|nr:glutamate-5-semialdehyde dehydrogenase [uncultured Veillonella sp.]MDY3974560.1 glutamate-5-semialdehyde dehydrogenase [Veillonella caviae]